MYVYSQNPLNANAIQTVTFVLQTPRVMIIFSFENFGIHGCGSL